MERGHFLQAIQRPMIRMGVFAVCVAFVWLVILSALNTAFRYAVFPALVLGGWMALGLLTRTFWAECLPLLRDLKTMTAPIATTLKHLATKLSAMRARSLRSVSTPNVEQTVAATLPSNPENHA